MKRAFAALCLLLPLTLVAASAGPAAADSRIPFDYRIKATTHLKKLNQTVSVPAGSFTGSIDINTRKITGTIKLPPATISMKLAGVVPLVTATVQIAETKPVKGTIDFSQTPFAVVATATFNMHIVSAYAGVVPINLVGDNCVTEKPVSVTMSGTASIGSPANFSGPYTIPDLKDCGVATAALNLLIPGPGNTFSAHATPKG